MTQIDKCNFLLYRFKYESIKSIRNFEFDGWIDHSLQHWYGLKNITMWKKFKYIDQIHLSVWM